MTVSLVWCGSSMAHVLVFRFLHVICYLCFFISAYFFPQSLPYSRVISSLCINIFMTGNSASVNFRPGLTNVFFFFFLLGDMQQPTLLLICFWFWWEICSLSSDWEDQTIVKEDKKDRRMILWFQFGVCIMQKPQKAHVNVTIFKSASILRCIQTTLWRLFLLSWFFFLTLTHINAFGHFGWLNVTCTFGGAVLGLKCQCY